MYVILIKHKKYCYNANGKLILVQAHNSTDKIVATVNSPTQSNFVRFEAATPQTLNYLNESCNKNKTTLPEKFE